MRPVALGYVGFRAADLSDWRDYSTRHLGFQVVDRSGGSVAFRMDDRKQRVVVEADGRHDPSGGVKFLGWEAEDGAGVRVERGSRPLAEERRVADLIVLADPLGLRLEIFHGGEVAGDPFKP